MRKFTRRAALLLAAVLMWSASGSPMVRASEPDAAAQADNNAQGEAGQPADAYQQELQKVFDEKVQTNELKGWPEGTGIYAEAGIVMDAESGAVLYAKNIDKKEYPASITKLLTALLAFEYADMDDQVVITPESLQCLGSGYASIGMKEGNVISMEQALYAMLLASSNEVAYAVAETVAKEQGEDYQWFLDQMNEKVKELGGTNSNFVNANGVQDEQHYTCARDMALIASELFDYPEFLTICQTQNYTIPASATTEEHVFQQKHEMLLPGNSDYYEYAVGGKTGYTTEANNTLVTLADNGDLKLVCVTLKAYPGHVYPDQKLLLDYGFSNFSKVKIRGNENEEGLTSIPEDAHVTLPDGIDFQDLKPSIGEKNSGKKTALLRYTYRDNPVGETRVEIAQDVSFADLFADEDSREKADGLSPGQILMIVAAVLIAAAAAVAGIRMRCQRQRRRYRRGRRRKR